VILLGVCCAGPGHTESVFSLGLRTDLPLGIGSISLFGASQLLSPDADEQQPASQINSLDRAVIRPYDDRLDSIGTYLAYAALVTPALTGFCDPDFPDQSMTHAAMYAEAFLLTYGTKDLLKAIVSRHRPYTYAGPIPESEEGDYHNSFPSGHTSLAFLAATFLSYTFAQEYPESSWRIPIAVGSFTLATTIGAARVLSGSHFVTDVLAGAAIGVFWGWLVPRIHLR